MIDINDEFKKEISMGLAALDDAVQSPSFSPEAQLDIYFPNKDIYEQMAAMQEDPVRAQDFINVMRILRQDHYDNYINYWWWYKNERHIDSADNVSDDGSQTDSGKKSKDSEPTYRQFMITQFLAPPFGPEWNDDRDTLKQGAVPLITEDQICKGLAHKSIDNWAWIWHDRDIYTAEDEAKDDMGQIHEGDKKFKHVHVVIHCANNDFPESTIAKWFGVPKSLVKGLKGHGSFIDGVEYLAHESPEALRQNKTHYDYDEIVSSDDLDVKKEVLDLQERRAKYGKKSGKKPEDVMRLNVLLKGWTMRQCREADPVTYARIKNSLPTLRLDFLTDADPCPFRLTMYIDGPGGVGKSSFARYIAESMFPTYDDPYFCIGNDERVTFDGYDGQPCVIFDDMRAVNFISQFGRGGTFRLLDPNPTKTAQQAKYSRVILNNMLTIINGVEPYQQFIDGLAGTYTDKRTGTDFQAEDENQAWRRMPLIVCIHSEDFDILVNKGFVNNDLEAVKSMEMYANVRANLKYIMQHLDGAAKQQALDIAATPVFDAAKMIEESRTGKITDLSEVPEDMIPVVRTPEEVMAEREAAHDAAMAHYRQCEEEFAEERRRTREEEERANEENYRQSCTAMLTDFCDWFWNAGDRYAVYSKTRFFKRKNGKKAYFDKLMTDDDFFQAQYDSALDAFARRNLAGKSDLEGRDFIRITKRNMEIFDMSDIRYGLKCVYEGTGMDFSVGHFVHPK